MNEQEAQTKCIGHVDITAIPVYAGDLGTIGAPTPKESVQSLSRIRLFSTPWTAAEQGSLSITNSRSLLKLMSIKSVMPSNHLIVRHPLLLLPSILPSIRGFSSESVLRIRWPECWSFREITGRGYSRYACFSTCMLGLLDLL